VLTRLQRTEDGLEAHLSDASVIACDVVVSAIGLRPRTDLAAAAGLRINRGIEVDRHLRTSHANIYALGDCAQVDGLSLLYVMPLMSCARALAQTLAGILTAVSYGPCRLQSKPRCARWWCHLCRLVAKVCGRWKVRVPTSALCRDADGKLLGYALTGEAVREKLALNKELPALLA
jgi:rubredoxin-NAD+ reductase